GEAAAGRGGFAARTGRVAEYDLLDAIQDGRVQLSELKEDELPPVLQKLDPKAREAKIAQLRAERETLLKKIGDLARHGEAYTVEGRKKQKAPADSFDEQVLKQLRSQARRIGVEY